MTNSIVALLRRLCPQPQPTYYHGGAPGLSAGDIIRPRNTLPTWRNRTVTWGGQDAATFGDHDDTVSFTTDIEIAKAYAGEYLAPTGLRETGQIYRVEPLQPATPDPDWLGSLNTIARCAQGAKIIQPLTRVPPESNPRFLTKALGKHFLFRDGTGRAYDENGYLNSHPALTKLGATPAILQALGPWFPLHLLPPGTPLTVPKNLPPTI